MHGLVELAKINPRILLEIRYATVRNFTGRKIYFSDRCFLQKNTAERLSKVQENLEKISFGLKVLDAYRPRYVQEIFWEIVRDSRYIAHPSVGSKHSRGAAVDVTLVDHLSNELEMPSEFDEFSEKSSHSYNKASLQALKNRNLLKEAMIAEGFIAYEEEWWHYDDPNWESYPLLDVRIESLIDG